MFLVKYCSHSAVDEEYRRYGLLQHQSSSSSVSEEDDFNPEIDIWNQPLEDDFHQEVQQTSHGKTQRKFVLQRIARRHTPQLLKRLGRTASKKKHNNRKDDRHVDATAPRTPSPGKALHSRGRNGKMLAHQEQQHLHLRRKAHIPHPLYEIRYDLEQPSPSIMGSPSFSLAAHHAHVDQDHLLDVFPPFLLPPSFSDDFNDESGDGSEGKSKSDKENLDMKSPQYSDPATFLQLSDHTSRTSSASPFPLHNHIGMMASKKVGLHPQPYLLDAAVTKHMMLEDIRVGIMPDSPSTVTMHGLDVAGYGSNMASSVKENQHAATKHLPKCDLWKESIDQQQFNQSKSHRQNKSGSDRALQDAPSFSSNISANKNSRAFLSPVSFSANQAKGNVRTVTPEIPQTSFPQYEYQSKGNLRNNHLDSRGRESSLFGGSSTTSEIDWDYSFIPTTNRSKIFRNF